MKDMKNGIQKNSTKGIRRFFDLKYLLGRFREYKDIHREDIYKIAFLMAIGFVSAIIIQTKVDVGRFIGSFLIAFIILFILYKDIKRYKPGYLRDYKMLLLLGLLVVTTLFIGKIFEYLLSGLYRGLHFPAQLAEVPAYIFGIPIPIGAMLVALIFDFHTAIIFSFIISLLTGIWFDSPLYTIYAFIGSLTVTFSVVRCKKRSALVKGGIYVSTVNTATAGIILLLGGNLFDPAAAPSLLFAVMSGIIVASIVFIILPFIEYLFGITTDISLIELLDMDQPLMRNLMITAPGTYHHSVIVSNLAEAAAEAVGANPLLARVTAYYHDIGKMKMPEYFIENQTSAISKHDKLTPHMSSMILISHVKEGVELARQHKLPKLVIDIIQQHHGTSLIAYFYQKAVEQGDHISQDDYRYPGPKPQTRVAALVMMADAVEAASRALTDPTPARISALVERIINTIFLDGQIDECELTLKDISEIKRRFTYILTSIFHKRIAYPDAGMKRLATQMSEKTNYEEPVSAGHAENDSSASSAKGNGNNYHKQTEAYKDKPAEDKKSTEKNPPISER
jgi:putative nucleotidyltransferase with HDIG domain